MLMDRPWRSPTRRTVDDLSLVVVDPGRSCASCDSCGCISHCCVVAGV